MQAVLVIGLATFIVLYAVGAAFIAWLWLLSGRPNRKTGEAASGRPTRRQGAEIWSAARAAHRVGSARAAMLSARERRVLRDRPPRLVPGEAADRSRLFSRPAAHPEARAIDSSTR
jgi:hypothetical protein